MTISANPLPDSGVVGKLTQDETEALRQFWRELFKLIDSAPVEPRVDPQSFSTSSAAPEKSDKTTPKDDSAKERQRATEELQLATLAFEQYGSRRFVQTFWRFVAMDHPDSLCLKFLRARKWSPTAGVAMFAACMKWRIESGVEDISRQGEEGLQHGEGFLHQMTSGKAYLHGLDRSGRPVFYVHARMHKTSEQTPKALEDFVLFQMESLRCLAHATVEKVTMVFDLTGFGLSNMDWRCLWFIVKCLESYYPESLNVIIVHNPPWVFNGIWKVVSPALDPQVRSKVQLTKSAEELHIHIDPSHLAPSVGGRNTWAWQYPNIVSGENRRMEDVNTRDRLQGERDDLAKEFEEATRRWVNQEQSTGRDETRERIARQLRAHYFDLDPFIRGRGAYHRLGNIVGNGLVAFHYPGAHDLSSGEYEVVGLEGSKETLESQLGLGTSSRAPTATCQNGSSLAAPQAEAESVDTSERIHDTAAPQVHHSSHINETSLRQEYNTFHDESASNTTKQEAQLSRQSSRGSRFSEAPSPSLSSSIPTQKSGSTGKIRKRLTSSGSKIKQFGSIRSLTSKAK